MKTKRISNQDRIKTYLISLDEIRRCKAQIEQAYEMLIKEERKFLHKIECEEDLIDGFHGKRRKGRVYCSAGR